MTVLHCGYRFMQVTDRTGIPTSMPMGGKIDLVLESDGGTELFEWMVHPTHMKCGLITFYKIDAFSKLKTLEFIDAYCVDYYETFDHSGERPMQVQLTLSAHGMKLNDSEFKNSWPEVFEEGTANSVDHEDVKDKRTNDSGPYDNGKPPPNLGA
ncbi:MAG: type VI secretion system tube protein TssD [Bacteroidota bacterium]